VAYSRRYRSNDEASALRVFFLSSPVYKKMSEAFSFQQGNLATSFATEERKGRFLTVHILQYTKNGRLIVK
jgi:hypothetical protein